jgi:hypothetical protein
VQAGACGMRDPGRLDDGPAAIGATLHSTTEMFR